MQLQGCNVGTEPILFVIDHFRNPHAGTEGQLFQLIKGLDRSRFIPYLLVFSDSDFLREQGFPCDYEVLGHSRLASPATWLALWKFARRFSLLGGRLAHVFFNDPSVICPPVFRSQGIKTIISRRDMGYWYTHNYLIMLKLSGHFVAAAITNSHAVKKVTIENEPVSVANTHVIYNGYEFDNEKLPAPSDLLNLRAKNPDAVFAGIVANVRPIKRIEDAIRAVGAVAVQSPELHLVVIGDGNADQLRGLARACGAEKRIHFLGARKDVKDCLSGLDVGVLCSESEGFSNAVIEYMQAGLPVVCSEVGGNPEAITHGETGFLYLCGNIDELADCLKTLTLDSELRARLGKNARISARQRFSMETMVRQHEEVYQQLLVVPGSSRVPY